MKQLVSYFQVFSFNSFYVEKMKTAGITRELKEIKEESL